MSEYDTLVRDTQWDEKRWYQRRDMMEDVWKDNSEQQMKEIIALLIFQAHEVRR